ncbi:MAG: hypothetical protein O3C27_13855 [Actinomycetota bacterium]|nr:hypothetical protein [Actinomycetota bacterium]
MTSDQTEPEVSAALERRTPTDHPVLPFDNLIAPTPLSASPPEPARWLAFVGVLVGGLLGGLIGYGVADLLSTGSVWPALGGLVGAIIGAAGVGVVSALTLRAMGEWRAVEHPEARRA